MLLSVVNTEALRKLRFVAPVDGINVCAKRDTH
jgi:hypothetical protein